MPDGAAANVCAADRAVRRERPRACRNALPVGPALSRGFVEVRQALLGDASCINADGDIDTPKEFAELQERLQTVVNDLCPSA